MILKIKITCQLIWPLRTRNHQSEHCDAREKRVYCLWIKKMNFALLTSHPCLLCYLVLNMQPIFIRLHPSLPKMYFISSKFDPIWYLALLYIRVQRNGDVYTSKGFCEDKHIFFGFHSSVKVTPNSLWAGLATGVVWLATRPHGLICLAAIGWFYFISYSYQVVHFGGWEHCVKVWWVTRSKSKVSRPLFPLVLEAEDMICFVVKSENLMKRGSVKQTTNSAETHLPCLLASKVVPSHTTVVPVSICTSAVALSSS